MKKIIWIVAGGIIALVLLFTFKETGRQSFNIGIGGAKYDMEETPVFKKGNDMPGISPQKSDKSSQPGDKEKVFPEKLTW